MRWNVGIVAFIAAVTPLAACSSSPSKPASAPTTSGQGTTLPEGTVASSTSTSPVAPPTTAAGPGRCSAGSLKGTFATVPGGGSAGHQEAQLVLTNTGSAACHMFGYVGMQLLDASGSPLPTNVVRVPGNEREILLAPGASADVLAQFSPSVAGQGDSTTGPCQPVAKNTQVTPPDDTKSLIVAGPDSSVCQRGTIQIMPVVSSNATGQ